MYTMVCGDNLFKYLFDYMEKESSGQTTQGSMLQFAERESSGKTVLEWNDEIEFHRRMRVKGPYEAVFRILGIPLTYESQCAESC